MRETLFRGKRIDNGEWIEGSLISNDHGRCFIAIHPSLAFGPTSKDEINGETLWGFYPFFEVDPSTVGQCTGLIAHGKKIFGGDIVKLNSPNIIGIICFGKYAKTPDTLKKTFLGFYIDWHDYGMLFRRDIAFYTDQYGVQIEVIGNIHDNPELIDSNEEAGK